MFESEDRAWQNTGAPSGGYTLTADSGTFMLTGAAAGLQCSRTIAADGGTFTLTGADIALEYGRKLGADAGTFTLSGQDVALNYSGAPADYTLTADAGTFSLSGLDTALRANRTFAADGATLALSGQNVGLLASRTLPMTGGTFTLMGADAALQAARTIAAASGTFTLAGQDVTLTYSTGYTLTADGATFTLSGAAITLTYSGAPQVATITITERIGPFPVGHPIYLYFLLQDSNGDPVAGVTIADFTLIRMDNGQVISPHGLYMTEIGSGWYYLGTAEASAFTATEEIHTTIDMIHVASGAQEQMAFFCIFMEHDQYRIQ